MKCLENIPCHILQSYYFSRLCPYPQGTAGLFSTAPGAARHSSRSRWLFYWPPLPQSPAGSGPSKAVCKNRTVFIASSRGICSFFIKTFLHALMPGRHLLFVMRQPTLPARAKRACPLCRAARRETSKAQLKVSKKRIKGGKPPLPPPPTNLRCKRKRFRECRVLP